MTITFLIVALLLDYSGFSSKIVSGIREIFGYYVSTNGFIVYAIIMGLALDALDRLNIFTRRRR